ncbi:hypothetical protein HETIRDRAFT_450360 [Heterobasidion irregulare TC 32-1]|uniref:Retrotransposon gag domain-containing protein n=1 Tax=Heterobasidion irregulare (strain TC 32-1) TaxID=747525 RepID=W4KAX4_HETIT|nr:uncharacterized protein HETIRDRAFT_450360 [Heterobasidion irregulare TC 32-1]ETW82515.1 hypothetical protein HETIRDRAFT_450360 [Heterobasidion irregulare TC 32-1]
MTVDEYSNQFILIAADADISDKEQVPYFQRGLDPRIMDKIYDKEGEETARLIWREKTTHPLWETKREYIEEWRQRMSLAMTSGYHNLVLQWNVLTLPHPDDPKTTMGNALCYLTDDRETEASVILLESEQY